MNTHRIENAHLTALATLAHATSKDKMSPILGNIHIIVNADTITGNATDRYQATRMVLPLPNPEITESVEYMVSAADLNALAKTGQGAIIDIPDTEKNHEITATLDNGSVMRLATTGGNYPPIARLFPDNADHDVPAGTLLNPELLAKLFRFRMTGETVGYAKTAPYRFSAPAPREGDKLSPLVLTRDGQHGGTIEILMQTNTPARR